MPQGSLKEDGSGLGQGQERGRRMGDPKDLKAVRRVCGPHANGGGLAIKAHIVLPKNADGHWQ